MPIELHLVHLRSDLASAADGMGQPDGLAVLGVFFTLVKEADQATGIDKLLNALGRITGGSRLPPFTSKSWHSSFWGLHNFDG